MSNEHIPTVHDFDLICEFFLSFDRQGPGSLGMTLRALSFVEGLGADSRIADLGCGTGGQTMTLASATTGSIVGLDLFSEFIDRFNGQAATVGFAERVQGIVGSMDDLPFAPESLDLIWSEGAIYNIGFERGMQYWRQFLKPGGYVAVTENTWFTDDRPDEIQAFWNAAYPEIDTIPNKIAGMQRAGYEFIAAFTLPEICWTENFYDKFPAAWEIFKKNHAGNPAAEAMIESDKYEISLYEKYKAFYGYVFYIGRKV
jgi:SAM-dependent methyltransferase